MRKYHIFRRRFRVPALSLGLGALAALFAGKVGLPLVGTVDLFGKPVGLGTIAIAFFGTAGLVGMCSYVRYRIERRKFRWILASERPTSSKRR